MYDLKIENAIIADGSGALAYAGNLADLVIFDPETVGSGKTYMRHDVLPVFSKLQEGLCNRRGIASTETLSAYEYSQPADITHQAAGAVIVLVLFGLYTARGHLADVGRKLWQPGDGVDDSEELMRYRTALLGFLLSLTLVALWLWFSGVPLVVLPVLLIVSLIFSAA